MSQSFIDERVPSGLGGRFYGVYPAIVVDIADPDGQARIKVRLPWAPDPRGAPIEAWARLATLMAGANRGSLVVPDVDDEVLVAFGAGDVAQPFVVGALWNGRDAPPEVPDSQNSKKVLRSREGVSITLEDQAGRSSFVVETPAGQRLTLQDGPGGVKLEDQLGSSVTLAPEGVTLVSPLKVSVQGALVELSATAIQINSATVVATGAFACQALTVTALTAAALTAQTVTAQTVTAQLVAGASYTPGVGNTL